MLFFTHYFTLHAHISPREANTGRTPSSGLHLPFSGVRIGTKGPQAPSTNHMQHTGKGMRSELNIIIHNCIEADTSLAIAFVISHNVPYLHTGMGVGFSSLLQDSPFYMSEEQSKSTLISGVAPSCLTHLGLLPWNP